MFFRYLCFACTFLALVLGSGDVLAQKYAGFIDEARFSTSDSLMNVGGMEYYLLYENYENVHFLSLVSQKRETFVIGPAVPEDTLYQDGDICGRLGVENLRLPLDSFKNNDMLVTNKYPDLFVRCESVSPCNFKVCDTNNFGYKIIVDYPTQDGERWDFIKSWTISFIDSITNMDMMYFDDVYMETNIDDTMLPTQVLKKRNPEAFEIEDINDGQAVVDHFRDLYMRQVYYLKNLDFSFPLSYLRIFISPRYVSDRYVTFFVATNLYAYGAHDFPLEHYVTFDMERKERVRNDNLFLQKAREAVKGLLEEEMKKGGQEMGDAELPQAAIYGDGVVFSFQPYQVGTYAEGISHFFIGKEKLRKYVAKDKWW